MDTAGRAADRSMRALNEEKVSLTNANNSLKKKLAEVTAERNTLIEESVRAKEQVRAFEANRASQEEQRKAEQKDLRAERKALLGDSSQLGGRSSSRGGALPLRLGEPSGAEGGDDGNGTRRSELSSSSSTGGPASPTACGWSPVAMDGVPPARRSNHVMLSHGGGRLLIFGGFDGAGFLGDLSAAVLEP